MQIKLEKKLEVSIEKYSSLVDVIFDGKRMLWKVYILNLLQRLSQIIVNTFFLCSIAWRFTKASTVISNTDLCCYGFKLCPDSGRNGSDRLSDVERLSAAYEQGSRISA